jgi:hypothetical protein
MEKFLENLEKAKTITQTADHLVYITYPLIKDKKLLLKILLEIKNAIVYSISSILQYEYLYKRITLQKDPKTNFRTFKEKCAPKYNITESEIDLIIELLEITEKHKKAPMEFMRKEKLIILSENSIQTAVNMDKIKSFISLAKKILINIENKFLSKI